MFSLILLTILKFLVPTVVTFLFLDRISVDSRVSLTVAIIFGVFVTIFASLFTPAWIGA